MQTILGPNGVMAFQLAKYLKAFDSKIRLVSSAPVNVNKEEELMRTNLMNPRAVSKTVNGSDIVYLVGDLTFKTKTWQEQPYLFDSAKFNSAFPFNTTSYDAGSNKSIFVKHLM